MSVDSASGALRLVAPFMVTPASQQSLGVELAALSTAAPISAGWPGANRALYVPFTLSETVTVVKMFSQQAGLGGAQNIDVGIYNEGLSRLVSSGSTLMDGTNILKEYDITDIVLGPGRYYMAVVIDSISNGLHRWSLGSADRLKLLGIAEEAAAFPLPATATPAVVSSDYIPVFGLSLRTLVA